AAAAAHKMDHFAAECLVSMSHRAVVHAPKGNREIKPELPCSPKPGEDLKEPLVRDNSSLFVVARILADFNQQQTPANNPRAQMRKSLWKIVPPQSPSKDTHRSVRGCGAGCANNLVHVQTQDTI
uniref:Uncharacterized protein n=1 Tax=Periophthalmus magnuspinnatus TaxID=409849 RepID=A0A3B3ZXJ8_9GOBI